MNAYTGAGGRVAKVGAGGMGGICKRIKKKRKEETCLLFADCKSEGNTEIVG